MIVDTRLAMSLRFTRMLLLAVCSVAASAQAAPPQDQAKKPAASKQSASATQRTVPSSSSSTSPEKPAPGAETKNAVGTNPDPTGTNPDDRNFSSSREGVLDLSPPKDDRKDHPNSSLPGDEDADDSGVQELHSWNPLKALKAIEVGDYYFKRKNYRAALNRYKEALEYKEGDAVATFRLAQCQERMGNREAALENYAAYLKILPHGPFAQEARDSIEDLKAEAKK